MNQRKTKKYMGYSGLLVILLIAIDQFTKWLAYTHLYQKPDVSVIDGVFQLNISRMTVLHLVWIRFLFCSGFFILLILTAIRKLF